MLFAASPADVRDVLVGGRHVVADGRHATLDVPAELRAAIGAVLPDAPGAWRRPPRAVPAVSVLIDNIGTLVTNDPELGRGPLGLIEDAALILDDGTRRSGPARAPRSPRPPRPSASTPAAAR